MSYWPQLLRNFTAHVYDEGSVVQIEPSQIPEVWKGREVNVILIGNHHRSGTLTKQTRELISSCISAKSMSDRAVFLGEGLKAGKEFPFHFHAPQGVRVIGSDCRRGAIAEQTGRSKIADDIETLIVDANKKSYDEIKDWCKSHIKLKNDGSLVFERKTAYDRLMAMMKEWSKQDDALNQTSKGLLSALNDLPEEEDLDVKKEGEETESSKDSESEWEDIDSDTAFEIEFYQANQCLANLIETHLKESPLVFAVWGDSHFTEDLTFYEKLQEKEIKPLILLPKEANELGYKIEFARWMEAVECDHRLKPISGYCTREKAMWETPVPVWMSLMLTKILAE